MSREKVSLNTISEDAACELIQSALDEKSNIKEIFVDTVGVAEKYESYLTNKFKNYNIKFTVKPKADSIFPCVSAASIVAKVTRDQFLLNWNFIEENSGLSYNKEKEKKEGKFSNIFGSGYPGDPVTKKWMENNFDRVFGYPNIVRFDWKTTKNYLKAKNAVEYKWY
jgi:ribonuclease H2 subunit A